MCRNIKILRFAYRIYSRTPLVRIANYPDRVGPSGILVENSTKLTCPESIGYGVKYSTWCVQVLRSPKEAFVAAMQSWRERCEKCVCLQGDYVEK